MTIRILLVDDDPAVRRVLQYKLARRGYEVVTAADGALALARLAEQAVDLILSDMRMPNMDGLALLSRVKDQYPDIEVILLTAYASVPQAVAAVKRGAFDYLTKPFDDDQLWSVLDKAVRLRQLSRENRKLKQQLRHKDRPIRLLGVSPAMTTLAALIEKVAATDATVLITGESGTGKELVARSLHARSLRADRPFIAINCAAIPRDLLESELFGHVRGAFTGAVKDKKGKFLLADTGTLFLDEISEMSADLQAKLLRALQEREIEPVGSEARQTVDVRVLAATNVDLRERVAQGKFREDLFYRLNVIPLVVPPLRDRATDIPLLAQEFLNRRHPDMAVRFSPALLEHLTALPWPGNVRELENLVERMGVLRNGDLIDLRDLPIEYREPPIAARMTHSGALPTLHDAERELIVEALRAGRGNKSKAAQLLNVPRHILLYRMKKYGIGQADY